MEKDTDVFYEIKQKYVTPITTWNTENLPRKYGFKYICSIDEFAGDDLYETNFFTSHNIGGSLSGTYFKDKKTAEEFLRSLKEYKQLSSKPSIWIRSEEEYDRGKGRYLETCRRKVWYKK